jgi:dehydrogenase/reductase SDR family protein 12
MAMARYIDAIDIPLEIEHAFDYLADFSRTAEWDPGVTSAWPRNADAPQLGSEFVVNISVLGAEIELDFEITEYEHPNYLVITGGNSIIRSIDKISFTPQGQGTRVTYEARVDLVGISQLADPLLGLLLQRVGQVAIRGLRERLNEEGRFGHATKAPSLSSEEKSKTSTRVRNQILSELLQPTKQGKLQ